MNVTTFIAGILIFLEGSWGLTPSLAFLFDFLNVPNPVNLTSPSFLTPLTTASTKELTNSPASFFETPNSSAND